MKDKKFNSFKEQEEEELRQSEFRKKEKDKQLNLFGKEVKK